jgi:ketosteroid isomerase-like protein
VFEDIAACYAPDAEIVSPSSEMFGRTYQGHEGLRLYIDHFIAAFEPPSFDLEEIVDAGLIEGEVIYLDRDEALDAVGLSE